MYGFSYPGQHAARRRFTPAREQYFPGIYPDGVADPARGEGAPQREAEIMAGRYVNASGQLVMPDSLAACLIGAKTAREINLDAVFQRRYGGT